MLCRAIGEIVVASKSLDDESGKPSETTAARSGEINGIGFPIRPDFRAAETWCQADFTGLMFFEARFVASLRIADHSTGLSLRFAWERKVARRKALVQRDSHQELTCSELQCRQRFRSIEVSRDTNFSPAFCIRCARRLALRGILDRVAA